MTMAMGTVHGRVRGGRIEVDEAIDLPDGTEVELEVLVDVEDGMDEHQRAELHHDLREALLEAERGEDVPMEQVLADLTEADG
jgi:hypothetical protein